MKVGELFVNLGIKGGEKTISVLSSAKSGMSDLMSASLATKAAILAAGYALQQMTTYSARAGTEMKNFSALTGIPMKFLQQIQYAASTANVSLEETQASLKGVQDAMTAIKQGHEPPENFMSLMYALGGTFNQARANVDTVYAMQKIIEGLPKIQDEGIRNSVASGLGLGTKFTAAAVRGRLAPEKLSAAPVLDDKIWEKLDRNTEALVRFETRAKNAMLVFESEHGAGFIKDISTIEISMIHLGQAFVTLMETIHGFEALHIIFLAIGDAIEVVLVTPLRIVEQILSKIIGLFGKLKDAVPSVVHSASEWFKKTGSVFQPFPNKPAGPNPALAPSITNANISTSDNSNSNTTNHYAISQNITYSGNLPDRQDTLRTTREQAGGLMTAIQQLSGKMI